VILLEVQIGSFAALSDCAFALSPGLNVLLGPNEAGKSTLFQGILHCLLTPVSLSRPQFQNRLGPYLPVGGGDTLSCAVAFRLGDRRFRLSKTWGATRAVELLLPEGSRLTDEQSVVSALNELLPAPAGTIRSVLAASQSGLSATIKELLAEEDTLRSLSDLLRRSVLATDGVSVVRFREGIRRRLEELLDHWDLNRGRPEGNKGLENRWKRKVGGVLEAFYQQEELRTLRDQVLLREQELGELGKRLEACLQELDAAEDTVREAEPTARDARERRPLEAELAVAQAALGGAQGDYQEWTRLSLEAGSLGAELLEQQQAVAALETELAEAEAGEAGRRLGERFLRARSRKEALEVSQARLQELPQISRGELQDIRRAAAELDQAQAAARAGGLSVSLQARRELTVSVQADAQKAAQRRLASAEALEIQAAGRLLLEHPDWRLEIHSGSGEQIGRRVAELADALRALLDAHRVSSPQEAEEQALACQQAQAEVAGARKLLDEELGEETYEALKARFEELAPAARPGSVGRPIGTIAQELGRARTRLAQTKERIEAGQRDLEAFGGRWGTQESLLARVVELTGTCRELGEKLACLTALPPQFADAASFLEHHAATERKASTLREQRARLEAECRSASGSLGDESSEEISGRLEEARGRFQGRLHDAQVLLRVQQASEDVLGAVETGVEEPFRQRFAGFLSALTAGRYSEAAKDPAEATLPQAVLRPDGSQLPYALLSGGTRDLFALALRLSMAELFLGDREGFLIMDDPLVDLDPQRQKLAAGVLSQFAASRQLLLFTCQPTHAALFQQARRIELSPALRG
jgi:exonuclease SbcC